jgi:L-seryl-tRNA(Ser) seleniumtransferase
VGGGAFPAAPLPTTVVRISVNDHLPERLDRELRAASPPIVARVAEDRLVIDLRTVLTGEDGIVLQSLVRLLA